MIFCFYAYCGRAQIDSQMNISLWTEKTNVRKITSENLIYLVIEIAELVTMVYFSINSLFVPED